MTKTFAADISKWSEKVQRRAKFVFRAAAQEVASEAQTVKGSGGRMPIDTGNLRGSFTSIGKGQATGPVSYAAIIAGADIGDTLRFEWRTAYAARMEFGLVGTDALGRNYNQAGNLFASTAIAKWAQHVDRFALQAESIP
jgi:hypothetical protein